MTINIIQARKTLLIVLGCKRRILTMFKHLRRAINQCEVIKIVDQTIWKPYNLES